MNDINFAINSLIRDLRVSRSQQTSIVDVGGAADDDPIVDNHQLGVDVDELGHRSAQELAPSPQRAEGDVIQSRNVELIKLPDERVIAADDGSVVVMLKC